MLDLHGNKSERTYYDFEGKRQVWEDERKCKECQWEIRRKTRKHEIKQCKFKDLNKMSGWWIIYITGDFNWLKNIVKNNQKLLSILCHQKTLFFLRVYKNEYICSIHCRSMEK